VTQGEGPEFKSQYRKKKEKKELATCTQVLTKRCPEQPKDGNDPKQTYPATQQKIPPEGTWKQDTK
jgi:hypothetical protein